MQYFNFIPNYGIMSDGYCNYYPVPYYYSSPLPSPTESGVFCSLDYDGVCNSTCSDQGSSYSCSDEQSVTQPGKRSRAQWILKSCPVPPFKLPGWTPFPYGLDKYWKSGFVYLFQDFFDCGHLWTLQPVEEKPDEKGGWSAITHTAKVRFQCPDCNVGWTSMHGRVIFWTRLFRNSDEPGSMLRGEVRFRLYKQKCIRCSSDQFRDALWYSDEIMNALIHLYQGVGSIFYGWKSVDVVRGVRQGKPLRPHKPELCQACEDGICRIKTG